MKDGDEDEGFCEAEGRLKKRKGRRGKSEAFWERRWLVWLNNTFVPQSAKPPSSTATTFHGGGNDSFF